MPISICLTRLTLLSFLQHSGSWFHLSNHLWGGGGLRASMVELLPPFLLRDCLGLDGVLSNHTFKSGVGALGWTTLLVSLLPNLLFSGKRKKTSVFPGLGNSRQFQGPYGAVRHLPHSQVSWPWAGLFPTQSQECWEACGSTSCFLSTRSARLWQRASSNTRAQSSHSS